MKPNTFSIIQKLCAQCGVTLIEAMVAMLVFSVGALGLAAMQLSAISSSDDNQQRTLAIWKAQEFADRIRSNPGSEAAYIAAINNSAITDLGVDSPAAAGVVSCGVNQYAVPAKRCSDYVANGSTAVTAGSLTCTDAETVSFDLWDVFCEPNTGLATQTTAATTVDGSAGLVQLEVILRQLAEDNDGDGVDDGTGDLELFFEWVSRAAASNEGVTNTVAGTGAAGTAKTVKTPLCSLTDQTATGGADNRVDVDTRLDTYCLKFR